MAIRNVRSVRASVPAAAPVRAVDNTGLNSNGDNQGASAQGAGVPGGGLNRPFNAARRGPMPRARQDATRKPKPKASSKRRSASGMDEDLNLDTSDNAIDGDAVRVDATAGKEGGDGESKDQSSDHQESRQFSRPAFAGHGTLKRPPLRPEIVLQRLGAASHAAATGQAFCALVHREMLAAMQSITRGGRLDQGGLARVKDLLLAHAPVPENARSNFNLMLPLLLLTLQRQRTEAQVNGAKSRLQLYLHHRGFK